MVIPGVGCKHCLGLRQRTTWYLNTLQTFEEDVGLTTWWRLYAHKEHFLQATEVLDHFSTKDHPSLLKPSRKKAVFPAWCMCFSATESLHTGNLLMKERQNRKAAAIPYILSACVLCSVLDTDLNLNPLNYSNDSIIFASLQATHILSQKNVHQA